jgi:hypothetical protein
MYSFNTYKLLINKKYLLNNWVAKISFISVAINGWQLAKQVYSDESTKKRRKQQIKYFFRFLFNSQFASVWSFTSPPAVAYDTANNRIYVAYAKNDPNFQKKPFEVSYLLP